MQTITKKISELKFAQYNPRFISEHDMGKLILSLKTYGLVEPVVINNDGTIIGGHQRVRAAQSLGWQEIDCVEVSLDPIKEKALNLALNRIHGEWSETMLAEVIHSINAEDPQSLQLTGFQPLEISNLLDHGMLTIPEDIRTPIDTEIQPDRLNVLTIEPPEAPHLKEYAAIHFEIKEHYDIVKQAILDKKLTAEKILKIVEEDAP